jgi:hypothetical protein
MFNSEKRLKILYSIMYFLSKIIMRNPVTVGFAFFFEWIQGLVALLVPLSD